MAKTIKKSLLMVPNHQCTLCLLILLPFYLFKKGSLGGCCGFLQWLRFGSRISDFMREAAWWALGLANPSILCTGASLLVENFYGHFLQSWDISNSSFSHGFQSLWNYIAACIQPGSQMKGNRTSRRDLQDLQPSRAAVRRQYLQGHWQEVTESPTWAGI